MSKPRASGDDPWVGAHSSLRFSKPRASGDDPLTPHALNVRAQ